MAYGIASWRSDGTYNNYGINPTNVVGFFNLGNGQVDGDFSFSVPVGCKLDVYQISTGFRYTTGAKRVFYINGGTISVRNGNGIFDNNTDSAIAAQCIVIATKA